jgi:hypothetical protein
MHQLERCCCQKIAIFKMPVDCLLGAAKLLLASLCVKAIKQAAIISSHSYHQHASIRDVRSTMMLNCREYYY